MAFVALYLNGGKRFRSDNDLGVHFSHSFLRVWQVTHVITLLPHQWSMKDLLVEETVNSIKREMITQKKERKKKDLKVHGVMV